MKRHVPQFATVALLAGLIFGLPSAVLAGEPAAKLALPRHPASKGLSDPAGVGLGKKSLAPLTPSAKQDKQLAPLPKLGFASHFNSNDLPGEQVMHVDYGSAAEKLGLEKGDFILAVNGEALIAAGDWNEQLARATNHDGWVTLKIRDARTGRTAYRTANLFRLNDR